MKKKTLIWIISLMTIAFIGLSIIQVFWIKNALLLKEKQFTNNVYSALADVSNIVERQEVNNRMSQMGFLNQLTINLDTIMKAIHHNGQDDIIVNLDSSITVSQSINSQRSVSTFNKTVSLNATNYDQNIARLFDDHNQFISNVFIGLFNQGIRSNLPTFKNTQEIIPIIDRALSLRGVDSEYTMAIFNSNGIPVVATNNLDKNDYEILVDQGYAVSLLKSNMFNNSYNLVLNFPNKRKLLLTSLWPMLTISFFLLSLILSIFGYIVFVIQKQKKLSIIKNDFIGNMTHELKTPISTISLACEALSDNNMTARPGAKDRYIAMIKQENDRLGLIVEDVLRTAIIDKGELKYNLEKLDLIPILNQVCKNIEIRITSKNGALIKKYETDAIIVLGDKTHLENVFYNLLDNAIKYSPNTPIISVKATRLGENYAITVCDNGIGISRENQSKIFDKLYRVPQGNRHDTKGFGLGLNYLNEVVSKHSGKVTVKSEIGKGSCFTINIPSTDE